MIDIGVKIPPFMMPLANMIRKKVEDTASQALDKEGEEADE